MFHKLENRKKQWSFTCTVQQKIWCARVCVSLSLSFRDLNSLSNLFNVDVLFTNTRISVYYVRVRAEKSFHRKNASEQPTPRSFHSETSAKIPNFIFPSPFSLFLSLFSPPPPSSPPFPPFETEKIGIGQGAARGKERGDEVVALVRAHNAHFSGTPRIPSLRFPRLRAIPPSTPFWSPIPFLSLAFSRVRTKVARLFVL